MFSTGQLIFATLFFVAFVIIMIFSYRKDVVTHQKFYKGSYKVLIAFFLFIAMLFVIKIYFKR
jgi:energy-coupling factor transporter transmembrane protein EcfT